MSSRTTGQAVSEIRSIASSVRKEAKRVVGRLQRQKRVTGESSVNMDSLPLELLARIMGFLRWEDILNLRTCSRNLQAATNERSVWASILENGCGTTFPRPFYLPKSIQHCSTKDLERAIRGWGAGLNDHPTPHFEIFPLSEAYVQGNNPLSPLGPLPGGRFFLYATWEGDIWCHDSNPTSSDSESPTQLLFPTPVPESRLYEAHVAFDVLMPRSDSTLGEDSLIFPKEFNLIITRCYGHDLDRVNSIEVWHLEPLHGSEGELARFSATRLAVFREEPVVEIGNCAILGKYVAYTMDGDHLDSFSCFVIVDWTTTPPGSTVFPRVFVPDVRGKILVLLPGKRIAAMQTSFRIWDWGRDCPRSTFLSSVQQIARVTAAWKTTLERPFELHSVTPFLMHDSIRIVTPTSAGLFGVIIPLSRDDIPPLEPEMIRLVPGKHRLSGLPHCQGYGYRRGVFLGTPNIVLRYSWPEDTDEVLKWRSVLHLPPFRFTPQYFSFDEISNRVSLFDDRTT
ncbi:hypothetical protein FA15DRAFT_672775 [Coprinopsis marcescibilis]|uniref:F-box domain-containing protein n=1 Tax=Coprinopsis marcescibilis TaxID=230819 RepID=A0A5C3KMW6_COPMA|nr:hypothetical protein FA15DRAFT_672775 [Coprinopsis marcescibilis]